MRTWQTAHVMKRRRGRAARRRRRRQPPRPALRRQVHDLPGGRPRPRRRGRLGRGRQAGRPRAVGPAFFGVKPARRGEGRVDRLGADGRCQRVDPHAPAGAAPADVRRCTARSPRPPASRSSPRRRWRTGSPIGSALRRRSLPVADTRRRGKADLPENDARPAIGSTPTPSPSASTASWSRSNPPPSCRWPSATSCSDGFHRGTHAVGRQPLPHRRARAQRWSRGQPRPR